MFGNPNSPTPNFISIPTGTEFVFRVTFSARVLMSDPLARLKTIDRRRIMLATYSRRIRLTRPLAPETERRMQKRIDARFNDLTRERRQLVELIKADPVLRQRFYDQEEAMRKAATPNAVPSSQKERDR